jgi:hypothetical protein
MQRLKSRPKSHAKRMKKLGALRAFTSGRLSRWHLLIFAILFGAIGLYIIRSFAAVSVTLTIDASNTDVPILRRYEQMHSKIQRVKGPADDQLLENIGTKFERSFWRVHDWSKGDPTDNGGVPQSSDFDFVGSDGLQRFSMLDTELDKMEARGVVPIVGIYGVPEWNQITTYHKNNFETNPDCPPHPQGGKCERWYDVPSRDYAKYTTMLVHGLKHIKGVYPGLEYIEAYNEPDLIGTGFSQTDTNNFYKAFSDAVKKVNADLGLPKSGQPRLKLGGPTTLQFNSPYMGPTLDFIKTGGHQFDFLSFHLYHSGADNPNGMGKTIDSAKDLLNSKGLSGREVLITEWAAKPEPKFSAAPTASVLAREMAYAAAVHHSFMQNNLEKSFIFAQSDYQNYERSILVPQTINSTGRYQINAPDGSVYPRYNLYKMMSKLLPTRISSTTPSDNLNSNGIGLNSIATKDEDTLSVLVWNYNGSSGTTTRNVTLQLNNLPEVFNNKSLIMKRYLVDSTHSNYAFNTSKQHLEQLPDVTVPTGGTSRLINVGQTFEANAAMLIVLEPTGTVSNQPPTVSLTAPADGTSFIAPANISIAANAADSNGTVTKVEFFNGSTKIGEDASSPYQYAWTNVPAGTYSLTAKAIDNAGASTTSSAATLTVTTTSTATPDLVVDSITMSPSSPKSGQAVTFSAVIRNQGSAATPAGTVIDIRFNIGGTGSYTYHDTHTTSLAPGASITLTANKGSGGNGTWIATAGNLIITAIADYESKIAETNETNNSKELTAIIAKRGDFNGDNKIDIFDLSMLLSKYNTTDTSRDLNGDGKVDIFDLSILLRDYGS